MQRCVRVALALFVVTLLTSPALRAFGDESLRGLEEIHLTTGVTPSGLVPGLSTEILKQKVTAQLREAEIPLSGPTLANLVVSIEVFPAGDFYLYMVFVSVHQQGLLNKDVVDQVQWLEEPSALALLWPAPSVEEAKKAALASFSTRVVTWSRTHGGTTAMKGEPAKKILQATETAVRQFIDSYRSSQ